MSDQISSKLDARRDTCPRCARGSNVEELGAASGTLWLHCGFCGHLWRQLAPEADAFSLILDSRTAHARPIEEAEAAAEDGPAPDSAPRFSVNLTMQYRRRGDTEWLPATTENVSRLGVLFRAFRAVDLETPIELLLVLPGAVSGEPPAASGVMAASCAQPPVLPANDSRAWRPRSTTTGSPRYSSPW